MISRRYVFLLDVWYNIEGIILSWYIIYIAVCSTVNSHAYACSGIYTSVSTDSALAMHYMLYIHNRHFVTQIGRLHVHSSATATYYALCEPYV